MTLDTFVKTNKVHDDLQFWGQVNGTPVTLLSVCSREAKYSRDSQTVNVKFEPGEIIIGRCHKDVPKTRSISASITALNNMFSHCPLDLIYDFAKDNPYLLKYAFPKWIETDDRHGHLQVYQTFRPGWTKHEIIHSIIPVIEYRFGESVGIMDALGRIAAVRNLFSFFANGYLPLENIKFADENSDKVESQSICDITLFLNDRDNILRRDEPFLITTADFEADFSHIWQNWLEIYEGAVAIPTLFYEVICNRSMGVNCFLNLTQSIEVYSNQYRKSEARELASKRENKRYKESSIIPLRYKFEDAFYYFNDCLEIVEYNIPALAKNLADMRNYYTHYNNGRYTEPSNQEMFSATHVLRFILLAIVYKKLGLSTETIRNARKRVEFQCYQEDLERILAYSLS